MKYAIFADIHSNHEALCAVIKYCQSLGVQEYYCVGDIVGYGANPQECLHLINKLKVRTVAGNHDYAVAGRLDASYFTEEGKAAVEWTRNTLSFEEISFLSGLETIYSHENFIMVHSTLKNPERFDYLNDITKAYENFSLMSKQLCFIGHTHTPKLYVQNNNKIYDINTLEIEMTEDSKYIVNVGSVGQPRDGIPDASFCIYDTKLNLLEIKRIKYNIQATQNKILSAGLPPYLAQRLTDGR